MSAEGALTIVKSVDFANLVSNLITGLTDGHESIKDESLGDLRVWDVDSEGQTSTVSNHWRTEGEQTLLTQRSTYTHTAFNAGERSEWPQLELMPTNLKAFVH